MVSQLLNSFLKFTLTELPIESGEENVRRTLFTKGNFNNPYTLPGLLQRTSTVLFHLLLPTMQRSFEAAMAFR